MIVAVHVSEAVRGARAGLSTCGLPRAARQLVVAGLEEYDSLHPKDAGAHETGKLRAVDAVKGDPAFGDAVEAELLRRCDEVYAVNRAHRGRHS